MLDDLAADVQPETAAVRLVGERVADLVELAEDLVLVLRADAPPVVADVDAQAAVALGERDLDPAVRRVAELRGVGQEVEHHLDHPVEVGRDDGRPSRAGAP